tara:strand:- start:227 stop:436 length:210 start_codon:yes stop_codon:yes gene_type:complete
MVNNAYGSIEVQSLSISMRALPVAINTIPTHDMGESPRSPRAEDTTAVIRKVPALTMGTTRDTLDKDSA